MQWVAQHARAHERAFQMHLANAAHERQICGTDRFGQIIHARLG